MATYSRGRATPRARCRTHHDITFKSFKLYLNATITSSFIEEPLIGTSSLGTRHYISRCSIILNLCSASCHLYDVIAAWNLPFTSRKLTPSSKALIPFFAEGADSLPPRGIKTYPAHSLSCRLPRTPPLLEEATQMPLNGYLIFITPIGIPDQVLYGDQSTPSHLDPVGQSL